MSDIDHNGRDTNGLIELQSAITNLGTKSLSRRGFMTAAAVVGASLAASQFIRPTRAFGQTGVITGGPADGATQFAAIPGRTQNEKVLNFALTLEILEADLYRQALNLASGFPLTAPLNSSPSHYSLKVGGGGLPSASAAVGFLYLQQFAYVEAAHRDFLDTAITAGGGTPVARNPGGYQFGGPVEANIVSILAAILPLEETGVRAYLGALPYLNDLSLAQTAGTIFTTEARHSSSISYILGIDPGPTKEPGDLSVSSSQPSVNTFEYFLEPSTVLEIASQFFVEA